MTAQQVAKVLRSLSLPDVANAYGFQLPRYGGFATDGSKLSFRLECGSGLAGRAGLWRIVEIHGRSEPGRTCGTQRELKRELQRWLAHMPGKRL